MYAELHAKTNFSFLEGASHPDEMVGRAAELGYAALAITDRASLAGVVRAHAAAKEAGIRLIVGAEIHPADAPPMVLWATDRAAYGRLSRLLTLGRRRAEKGGCRLDFDDVAAHSDGLLAGVWIDPAEPDTVARRLAAPREAFGDRCYLLAERHLGSDDRRRLAVLSDVSRRSGIPLVAAGGALYHVAARQALCDVLTAIRLGCTVAEAVEHLWPNAQRHLRPPAQLAALLTDVPEAIARSAEVAERCHFSLDQLRYEYPEELVPPGRAPMEYLAELAWRGAAARYPGGVPEKVRRLIEHELALIEQLGYEAYFLTVWDLVEFARRRGILCQGRGSAANSAVCYCLGITSVDPERIDVLFERFVSRERNEAPDIDVDFEHHRREEVIQYIYEKYGRDRAGMTAEVICYRPRSAVRDVGKALALPRDAIDALAKRIERFHEEPDLPARLREVGIDPGAPPGATLVELVEQLVGFPRHLSQHTGGMVITRGRLSELVPLENAAMPGRTVIQWNKDDLDELGVLKVDCLALGMLTAVHRCFDLVRRHEGIALDLAAVPPEDPRVYDMIGRADTIGVFQIESRAQMSMLPRLRPRCFYDLVIEVAIVRPGPIQGNMVHPYLRRRAGEEPVEYPDESIRRVLGKTLGVPLFQEQAMRLAIVAAGFTPGEADQLRRAMGAWRRPGLIDQFHRKLIDGMTARGFTRQYAETVFEQIRGFGAYGFPESHAASFALLVYVSAWLKCHHQAAFTCALLNSQPMGFYAPAQLVRDARRHGVEVRGVDVNFSDWDCTLEPAAARGLEPSVAGAGEPGAARRPGPSARAEVGGEPDATRAPVPAPEGSPWALRLGFRLVRGLARDQAERIVEARGNRPFASFDDFARRTGLSRAAMERLAGADVFASLGLGRRAALWQAVAEPPGELPLFDAAAPSTPPANGPSSSAASTPAAPPAEEPSARGAEWGLPPLADVEEVLADYRALGLSLRGHPMGFLRQALAARGVLSAAQLQAVEAGRSVSVAGVVLVRQRPGTAKGITFITLEDETGTANLIVRRAVWKRCRPAALEAALLLARGTLQRQGDVLHVVCSRLEDLTARLGRLGPQSRDFR